MLLRQWHVPIEQLSASALTMLFQCPEQFRLRRVKHIPDTRGLDKFIGIVDHATHEVNFINKIATGEDLPIDDMLSSYDLVWDREIFDEGEPIWNGEEPAEVNSHGKLMVQTYHELVTPTVTPVTVESRFEEHLKGVPVPIVGYTDVEEKNRLIERKTTKTRMSKPKPQWMLQGQIYSMFADKPVDWHIVTRAKTPTVCTPETDPGLHLERANTDATVLLIQQGIHMINDLYVRYGPDQPWPMNGLLHPFICGYCAFGPKYRNDCVAWREQ